MSKPLIIQAEINGYSGPAVNLMGSLDTNTGMLLIAKELKWGKRVPDAMVTSNEPRAESRDRFFTEDRLPEIIRLYHRAESTKNITFSPGAQQHNPQTRIQAANFSETGQKFQLHPDISNGAVAVLAILDAAEMTMKAEGMSDFAQEMADMFLSL